MEEYISINPRAEEMMLEYETVKGAALDWGNERIPPRKELVFAEIWNRK